MSKNIAFFQIKLFMFIDKSKKFSDFYKKYPKSEQNYQDLSRKIEFLVLHHVQATNADDAIRQFNEHQVSAHYLIDEEGKIYQLVDDNDIAYHAGCSYWKGINGLNSSSIGIEFINLAPFSKKFNQIQLNSGRDLCAMLKEKYNIKAQNIIGHSDIAYNADCGLLDRKADPSHLFDWQFMAQKDIGIYPKNLFSADDQKIFAIGDNAAQIKEIKANLAYIGYKVSNINEIYDEEMKLLARVFNRHFNSQNYEKIQDAWYKSSQMALDEVRKLI